MAPSSTQTLLSPAELSYLHTSLSLPIPVRPDGRSSTTFRPLTAETDILPSTNGSARICFADGTEAVVGVKAEIEKTLSREYTKVKSTKDGQGQGDVDMDKAHDNVQSQSNTGKGDKSWVETSIEVPGFRDDDSFPIFLAALLNEGLHARTELVDKLYINERFHWKLYIDVLLLSPPLSYPVPLLSLTIHLALLTTELPALVSTGEEDPLFNDDWEAAKPLYPVTSAELPPITLLVIAVADNLIFDPSKEELAVADAVIALSLARSNSAEDDASGLKLLALRTVDSPSRMTTPGIPDSQNDMVGGTKDVIPSAAGTSLPSFEGNVWSPRSGGFRRALMSRIVSLCLGKGGVADEVLTGLQAFRTMS